MTTRPRILVYGAGLALSGLLACGVARAEQRHMQDALDHLTRAREALQQAKADKAGYREKAIEHLDMAIEETRKGMEFAKEH